MRPIIFLPLKVNRPLDVFRDLKTLLPLANSREEAVGDCASTLRRVERDIEPTVREFDG